MKSKYFITTAVDSQIVSENQLPALREEVRRQAENAIGQRYYIVQIVEAYVAVPAIMKVEDEWL